MPRVLPPVAAPLSWRDLARGVWGAARPASAHERLTEAFREVFRAEPFFFSSGRAALAIALAAASRLSGRRSVVVPAYTCFSVAASIVRAGLEPVPCDIVPDTLDFDYHQLEELVTGRRPMCVIPTHLFGLPADVKRVRDVCSRDGSFVVEDAAQGFGFEGSEGLLGTAGDVGVFSFARGKTVSAAGGGALVTRSPELAREIGRDCAALPRPGIPRGAAAVLAAAVTTGLLHPRLYPLPASLPFLGIGETHYSPAFPMRRLSGAQAGLLLGFRGRVAEANRARAERLRLLGAPAITGPAAGGRLCLRLPVLCASRQARDELLAMGRRRGWGLAAMYPSPITRIPQLEALFRSGRYPGAEAVAERLVTVPVHPMVSRSDAEEIGRALTDFDARLRA